MGLSSRRRGVRGCQLALALALSLAANTAFGASIVLIAAPQTAGGVSAQSAGAIHGAVIAAAKAAGADVAVADDPRVKRALAAAKVSDLGDRKRSMAIGKAIGAHSVLRYQIVKTPTGVKLRMAIYVLGGAPKLLERDAPADMAATTAAATTKELLGSAGAVGSGKTASGSKQSGGAGAAGAAAGAAKVGGAGGSAGSGGPGGRGATGGAAAPSRRWDRSGASLRVRIGGAVPLGTQSAQLGMGVRFALYGGYEIALGGGFTLTPEAVFGVGSWSWKSNTFVATTAGALLVKGGPTVLQALAGVRACYYLWRVGIYVGAHFGYGNIDVSLISQADPSVRDDEAAGGFAFSVDFGATVHIVDWLAAGLFFDVNRTAAEVFPQVFNETFKALAFSFGFGVRGRL